MKPNATLAWDLAASQHYLITLAQLFALDYSMAQVKQRIAIGRLWPVYPGVYAVGHPGMTPERERAAAVLACGETAALSQLSAAVHHKLWEGPPPVRHHVSICDRSGRPGASRARIANEAGLDDRIYVHRPTRLNFERDTAQVDGVRVTTIARTLRDLAGVLTPAQLPAVFRQAERVHRFDLRVLESAVKSAPRTDWRSARIQKALAGLLDTQTLTQSEREELFLEICRRNGIPLPIPQRRFGQRRRADCLWPHLQLVAEIDDRASHGGFVAFLDDRRRDREAMNLGLEVIRFTVAECLNEAALVAADTQQAIARRSRLLALGLLGEASAG